MKKIISLGFVFALILAGTSSFNHVSANEVKASEYHECLDEDCVEGLNNEAQPKAVICISCGGTSRIVTTNGPWSTIEKPCSSMPHGTDEYRKRTVYKTYICSQCGLEIKTLTSTETEFVDCHGWF